MSDMKQIIFEAKRTLSTVSRHKPLLCRHVQMQLKPLCCRHLQEQHKPLMCRHVQMQLKPLW